MEDLEEMEGEFHCPNHEEDLPNTFEYFESYNSTLADVQRAVERDPTSYTKYWPVMATGLLNFEEMDSRGRIALYKVALHCHAEIMPPVKVYLREHVETMHHDSESNRIKLLNCVKMATYTLCHVGKLLEVLDQNIINAAIAVRAGGGARTPGKKKKAAADYDDVMKRFDWPSQRVVMLNQLTDMLAMARSDHQYAFDGILKYLWQPPVLHHDSLMAFLLGVCYKFIASSDFARNEDLKVPVFELLKVMLLDPQYKKCSAKVAETIIGMLQEYDHLGPISQVMGINARSPITDLIRHVCQDAGGEQRKLIVSEFMQEIGRLDSDEFKREKCAKSCSALLQSLVTAMPFEVFHSIVLINDLFNNENQTMRNCALFVITEIVKQLLSKTTDVTDEIRRRRTDLLETLQDHVRDVNALVRVYAIKMWRSLAEEDIIPVSFLQRNNEQSESAGGRYGIVYEIALRLNDNSSLVRRAAIGFLTTFLQRNPYNPKLDEAEVQAQVEHWVKRLHEIEEERGEYADVKIVSQEWEERYAEPMKKLVERAVKSAQFRARKALSRRKKQARKVGKKEKKQHQQIPNGHVKEEEDDQDENDENMDRIAEENEDEDSEENGEESEGDEEEMEVDEESGDEERRPERILTADELERSTAEWTEEWMGALNDGDLWSVASGYVQVCTSGRPLEEIALVHGEETIQGRVEGLVERLKDVFVYKRLSDAASDERLDPIEMDEKAEKDRSNYEKSKRHAQRCIEFFRGSLTFARQLKVVLPQIRVLFTSQQVTDVLAAIEFVVTCAEFKIPDADKNVRSMCNLIWHSSKEIKAAVVAAFERLYLNAGDTYNQASIDGHIATNLIDLLKGCSESEKASLQKMVCEMVQHDMISSGVRNVLWGFYTHALDEPTRPDKDGDARAAVQLLGMATRADRRVAARNLIMLAEHGFGERGSKNLALAADVCYAIAAISLTPPEDPSVRDIGHRSTQHLERFAPDHENYAVLLKMVSFVYDGFENFDDVYWTPLAENALDAVFGLADKPHEMAAYLIDKLVSRVMQRMLSDMRSSKPKQPGSSEEATEEQPNVSSRKMDIDGAGDENKENGEEDAAKSTASPSKPTATSHDGDGFAVIDRMLCRLLPVMGHTALRMFVHLQTAVVEEKLRRNKARRRSSFSRRQQRTRLPAAQRAPAESSSSEEEDEDKAANEMGLGGVNADEAEQEFVDDICKHHLLQDDQLLGKCAKLVDFVVNNHKCFSAPTMVAAVTAMTKMMLLSETFCDAHLHVLLNFLSRSPIASARTNMVIAAGDLFFRWPNSVEPFAEKLYKKIHDTDACVQQTALLVLTHLILTNMTKVKGYVAEIALIMIKPDVQMAGLAKTFFQMMSKKDNALYNLMIDIISRLSNPESKVLEDEFATAMTYLLKLVTLEKHRESLIEKLCQRFNNIDHCRTDAEIRSVRRKLSFCLAEIPYSEKSFNKLKDNTAYVADKLQDAKVFENFEKIAVAVTKLAKTQDMKDQVEEWRQQIEKCHRIGADDAEAAERAVLALKQQDKIKSPPGSRRHSSRHSTASNADVTQSQNQLDASSTRKSTRNSNVKVETAREPKQEKKTPAGGPRQTRASRGQTRNSRRQLARHDEDDDEFE